MRRAARDERGFVGGMEAIVLGVLIFAIGTLLIANAWGVIDSKLATASAAREAARAFVESPPDTALANAEQAAQEAMRGHGRGKGLIEVQITGLATRCSRITAEIRYDVPVIALPVIGRAGGTITTVGRHSEIVDPYRSGLPGEARC